MKDLFGMLTGTTKVYDIRVSDVADFKQLVPSIGAISLAQHFSEPFKGRVNFHVKYRSAEEVA